MTLGLLDKGELADSARNNVSSIIRCLSALVSTRIGLAPRLLDFFSCSTQLSMKFKQGSKCPSLPGLTHWVNPGLPGLGFKPYFGKVGNTGE